MPHIKSVDLFRLIAITSVIIIHAYPFHNISDNNIIYKLLCVIFNQLSRFAVPFFFIISGYFWGNKIRNGTPLLSATTQMLNKLLLIFFFWCFIYILPYNVTGMHEFGILGPFKISYWNILDFIANPVTLLFQGTKVHLWFIVGLSYALIFSSLFIYKDFKKSLIIISIFLYFFGLITKSYSCTKIGLNINFNSRDGLFFSTIFFVSGYTLSSFTPKPRWLALGILLFSGGTIVHFSETLILWKFFQVAPTSHDYLIGTYFMGLGVAIIALSNHSIFLRSNLELFYKTGKYTLGIYAIHFIFIDLLEPFGKLFLSPIWEITYILLVLILSTVSVFVLSRNKYCKMVVS